MRKLRAIILNSFLFPLLLTASSYAEQSAEAGESYCSIHQGEESSDFYCFDSVSKTAFKKEVNPLEEEYWKREFEDRGVAIISVEDYSQRIVVDGVEQILGAGSAPGGSCLEKVYYRVDEFNALPTSHSTVQNVIALARALHQAGVCELDVKGQSFNGINISSPDDVLHQFLCISNSESVFGTRNIGMGGRGPWGIHPMHNQAAGTRAFTGGRTVTLDRNGVCYGLPRAIVRDSNGREIKESNRYRDPAVQLQNAQCAMILYRQNGFRDWGTSNAWGSNRHCSASTRNRLQFNKHLGPELGCCTQSCKSRLRANL
ncbi:MAG: hypothetical protein CME60_07645 [Halobacteriovoraceae bacterium]|nr:hypothetical protein [Halobacteriovoraceae bacterium]|tara:strand:- start:173 stop:1117 length:945 start_codon:yes stop_codon:yes gene_type:complete